MSEQYVVVGSHDWTDRIFDKVIRSYPGIWTYINNPSVLTLETLSKIQPRLVFFFALVFESAFGYNECI